jgi:hypothetical protein
MYVTPGALFLVGIGVGVVGTLATIVAVALFANMKENKEK